MSAPQSGTDPAPVAAEPVESIDQSEGCIPSARPEPSQATCEGSGIGGAESPRDDQVDGVGPASPPVPSAAPGDELTHWEETAIYRQIGDAVNAQSFDAGLDMADRDLAAAIIDTVPASTGVGLLTVISRIIASHTEGLTAELDAMRSRGDMWLDNANLAVERLSEATERATKAEAERDEWRERAHGTSVELIRQATEALTAERDAERARVARLEAGIRELHDRATFPISATSATTRCGSWCGIQSAESGLRMSTAFGTTRTELAMSDRADLRRVAEGASLPWTSEGIERVIDGEHCFDVDGPLGGWIAHVGTSYDADLIVAAVNGLPGLLDENDQLRTDLDAMRARVEAVRDLAETWATQQADYDEDTEQQIEDGCRIRDALGEAE